MKNRISKQQYYFSIAFTVAKRSTCLRREIGAILVKDDTIIATGFNGAPAGLEHCTETTCVRTEQNIPSGEKHELCRAVHAEQNVICQAAKNGISIKGSTLYSTTAPCVICAKMIVNAGISTVVFSSNYANVDGLKILEEAGISIINIQEDAKEKL